MTPGDKSSTSRKVRGTSEPTFSISSEYVSSLPTPGSRSLSYGPSQMTHDLRRLRLHGLIARIPHSHRYRMTHAGAVVARFYMRFYARVLGPSLFLKLGQASSRQTRAARNRLEHTIAMLVQEARIAA